MELVSSTTLYTPFIFIKPPIVKKSILDMKRLVERVWWGMDDHPSQSAQNL